MKLNGVNLDVIKLQLFPFSLRDVVATWFESLPYGSVTTWEELVEAYLSRFFLPALTSEERGEIISFKQKEDEALFNAWERYKQLMRKCPIHGIEKMTQMNIFYHAMNYTSKGIIDAACCGAFKRKSAEEVNQLIKDLAKGNYRALSKTSGSNNRMRGGVIELNMMSAIEAKLEALMSKMGHEERKVHSTHEVGTVEGVEQKCIADEGLAHEGPYQVEEAQYVSSICYNFKPKNNLPTHYTPTLRNHENFSYGSGVQQGLRPIHNF